MLVVLQPAYSFFQGMYFVFVEINNLMQTKTIGIIIIIAGILMVVFTGFDFTTKEKVVDLGPIQVDKEKNHPVRWSPIIGGVLVVGGIALVLVNKKK